MLIVVSPAKTLDYETALPKLKTSKPRMLDDSETLVQVMRKKTPAQISSLMSVSDKIANLNADRFASWRQPFDKDSARPAVFAFKGDVYTGLEIDNFDKTQLDQAQKRLRILSGLYGLLRPLDQMLPYRLEMGTRLVTDAGENLYQFWGDRITRLLKKDMKAAGTDVLVNLASQEYFRAVQPEALGARIIEPVFEDEKNGKYKVISFYAKKARGMMAAWILTNNIQTVEELSGFDIAGYHFSPENSTGDRLVFRRPELDLPGKSR